MLPTNAAFFLVSDTVFHLKIKNW